MSGRAATTEHHETSPSHVPTGGALGWLDVASVVVLAGVALALRWAPPADGHFTDDAWQVLGATRGGWRDLVVTGQTQPLYNLALTLWADVVGDRGATMYVPALLAGVAGPPLLHLVLRTLDVPWSLASLSGAVLVASPTHVTFSARVKVYTLELVVVLGLVVLVPWLARRTWSRRTAVLWAAGSLLIAASSSFLLLAVAAAGGVLALHAPGAERVRRWAAVGAQAVGSAALVAVERSTYDAAAVGGTWSRTGAFLDRDEPLRLPLDLVEHAGRVVKAYVQADDRVVAVVLVAAAAGLLLTAWTGRHRVAARFLLACVAIAVLGSLARRVPFGATVQGGWARASLWLVPAVATGLALLLALIRRRALPGPRSRRALDAIVAVAAVAVLASTIGHGAARDRPGAERASRQVAASLAPGDLVLLTRPTAYPFATRSGIPVGVRATPENHVGFDPDWGDAPIVDLPHPPTHEDVAPHLEGARRVVVVHADVQPRSSYRATVYTIGVTLSLSGFHRVSREHVGTAIVVVWERAA